MTKQRATYSQRTDARPVWSQVTLEETGRGVRLVLPAVGFLRRRKDVPWVPAQSLFWVGVAFCIFVALMTVFFFFLAAENTTLGKPVREAPNALPWPIWYGLGGFWIIGLATLLGGLRLCRRRGLLEVTDQVLRAEQASFFGRRQWEWPREQIVAVQTGPTGITIGGGTPPAGVRTGGMRVAELQLYLQDGGRVRLFAGRAEEELNWLSGQLRRALQVGTKHYDGE